MNYIKKISCIVPLVLLLGACGGGGGSDSSSNDDANIETTPPAETVTPTETDTPTETVTPTETDTSTETNTPTETDTSTDTVPPATTEVCVDTSALTITASDSGNSDTFTDSNGNRTTLVPALAIDGLITEESRWSDSSARTLMLNYGESVTLNNLAILWHEPNTASYNFDIETSNDQVNWVNVLSSQDSSTNLTTFEMYDLTPSTAQYLRVIVNDGATSITEIVTNHCGDLTDIPGDIPIHARPETTSNAVAHDIELIDWYINTPEHDRFDDGVSIAVRIDEQDLEDGFEDDDYLYPSNDGGLVFVAPLEGARTSSGTKFTRTELREMLRRGDNDISTQGINKNNWVFSNATNAQQQNAAGVGGTLSAELSVNYVSISGTRAQVGRVIIGQIHANDDEPIRLYYRLLPGNKKGAIYFAHEPQGEDDEYVEMLGTRSRSLTDADNPDGIELNEKFSYVIDVTGTDLKVTIKRDGKDDVIGEYDMSGSGYYPTRDDEEQYMYFKAGVYNQNDTGFGNDYGQATFYEITNTHSSN